jgi:hypothetical protein
LRISHVVVSECSKVRHDSGIEHCLV